MTLQTCLTSNEQANKKQHALVKTTDEASMNQVILYTWDPRFPAEHFRSTEK